MCIETFLTFSLWLAVSSWQNEIWTNPSKKVNFLTAEEKLPHDIIADKLVFLLFACLGIWICSSESRQPTSSAKFRNDWIKSYSAKNRDQLESIKKSSKTKTDIILNASCSVMSNHNNNFKLRLPLSYCLAFISRVKRNYEAGKRQKDRKRKFIYEKHQLAKYYVCCKSIS